MRLKALPGDFRVREVLAFPDVPEGAHYVHLLTKTKLDTPAALAIVAREAGVERADIAFAGLKDRQGQTEQWISIRGRRVDLVTPDLRVRFVGRSDQPITSKLSAGNQFRIVVRDLGLTDVVAVRRGLPSLRQSGFVNYFDDQRFGCIRHGQGFAMREVLRGNYEVALHMLLARPSPVAVTGDVRLKRLLARSWGDWRTCREIARGPVFARVFGHLERNPRDFRGALEHLPLRLKLIHAYAYQSFLWNRGVSRLLLRVVPRRERMFVHTLSGDLVVWRYLKEDLVAEFAQLATPLWAPGSLLARDAFGDAMHSVLQVEQLPAEPPEEGYPAGMALREEPRAMLVRPRELTVAAPQADELNRGRSKLEFTFTLPRGSYATMLLKRLFATAELAQAPQRRQAGRPPRPQPGFHDRDRRWRNRER